MKRLLEKLKGRKGDRSKMVYKGMKCEVWGWIHGTEDRIGWRAAGKRVVYFQDL